MDQCERATSRRICETCEYSRTALNGVTMMCDAEGHERALATYRTHSCMRHRERTEHAEQEVAR